MGASKDMFIDLRMREVDYQDLPPDYRDKMDIIKVDEYKPKYPDDDLWVNLDAESKKAYKRKKEREFKLRNNIKK
jgi:hypothetical protein